MSTQVVLGGTTYHVGELDAWETFVAQPRIIPPLTDALKSVGPAIFDLVKKAHEQLKDDASPDFSEVMEEINSKVDAGDMPIDALANAVASFFAKLPPAELGELTRTLLAKTSMKVGDKLLPFFTPEGGEPFRVLMKGRTLHTWRLLYESVRLNYADFFGLFGAGKSAAVAEASKESSTSDSSPPVSG